MRSAPRGPLVSGDTRYFVYELLITSFLPGPREELGENMLPP